MLLLCVFLAAVRLFFSDERLRSLLLEAANARLPATVTLDSLDLSLLSGLELRGFYLGPPDGFEKEVAAFERVAITWSIWDLIFLDVVVEEVLIKNLRVAVEENETHGRNVDVLLAALSPPGSQAEVEGEEPPQEEPLTLAQPALPVRVEVRRLNVIGTQVALWRPDLTASVDHLDLSGRFFGQGDAIDLALRLTLGDESTNAAVKIALLAPEALTVDIEQRLVVEVSSSGLGDVRLGLELESHAGVARGKPLPPIHLTGTMTARADLFAQSVQLSECRWRLGDNTQLDLKATMRELLAPPKEQRLTLQALLLRSELAELSPIAGALVPGLTLSGSLELAAEPLTASIEGFGDPAGLSPRVKLELREIDFLMPVLGVKGVSADIRIGADAGQADLNAKIAMGVLRTAGQRFSGADLSLVARSPIAPWLGPVAPAGGPPPDLSVELELYLRQGGMAGVWSAAGARLRLDAVSPIDLCLNLRSARPLTADLALSVTQGTGGPAEAGGLTLRLKGHTFDFLAERIRAEIALASQKALVWFDGEALRAPDLILRADLEKQKDLYKVHRLHLASAGVLDLKASGTAAGVGGSAPRFSQLVVDLKPVALEPAFLLLPPSWVPPQTMTGEIGLGLELDGVVPVQEFMRLVNSRPVGVSDRDLMGAWFTYFERWSMRFARKMPFVLDLILKTYGFGFADQGLVAEEIDLTAHTGVTAWGPYLNTTVEIGALHEPETVRGIVAGLALDVKGARLNLASRARAGWYNRPELIRPVQNAELELGLEYRIGGDLLLERLVVKAPDRPAQLSLDGLIIKPRRMVLQDGWRREGLPGVAAEFRWRASYASDGIVPVVDGFSLGGAFAFDGQLAIEDGVLAVAGGIDCENLSLRIGKEAVSNPADAMEEKNLATVVDTVTGQLPFDLRLAFRPHPEATALAWGDIGFGGGRLGLLTSPHDIRRRPSRPVHYERLAPYRARRGLRIRRVERGNVRLDNLELDARIADGIVAADKIALHLLGGDVLGELAVQLSRDNEVIGQFDLKMSNIDASNFKALKLKAGPDSELSGDINLGFLFGPAERSLPLTINLTKIGSESFDRFLQFVQAESTAETKQKIEGYRSQLRLVKINEVAIWMRYEALNVDLDYVTTLPIGLQIPVPFFRPIPREMLRRQSLSGYLDVHLQPLIDKTLAPVLGWPRTAVAQGE